MKGVTTLIIGTAFAGFWAASADTLADEAILSQVQQNIIAAQIAALRSSEERALASGWSDAKKIAEFVCRPLAIPQLQTWNKDADRVFLGTDDPATLELASDRELTGTGQVRTGSNWTDFSFVCTLDPETGAAKSFQTNLS